ncbi:hypothetical protein [Vibrio crassostreae]|uniref:GIY-YIG nuclease family protein n=1 Tax=Vibrio crassostreae TaxID=246167 RepID=A0ABM9QNC6_9VIBR|nr:hypothetical protein [Vibrio crassostreae]TCL27623.1 hypothetical protein EDB52_105178 [Vibrio crassostreae]TCT48998.1 hypothetical protein EDB39_106179 [Vibrio crassostreae]TCT58578.1 hypothetical protein EDB40_10686 [Vibrio crassostreae]CAK1708709.1 conserved hypothetical protein [Vibrio crassostreae]CAK1710359.1 conserved hypothetical protein [Vibrio crassostreae]
MKAIVSLFISAYQPAMASIECRARSLNQSRQLLLCDEQRSEDARYEDICWMISRARRAQPLGYYVMYLRYVGYHSGYAKTVATRLRQHIALHPNLKESLSTPLITWLQQHEDAFCQTLHQQLTEFHTSR